MRLLIVLAGAGLLAIAAAYILLTQAVALFTIPVSVIVIIIGLWLAPPQAIARRQTPEGPSPLVVDRAVLGLSIYQLFFFETRLVLKRLATSRTTILAVTALTVIGFFSGDRLLGALAGIAAGYSMQEYAAQTGRVKPPVTDSGFKLGRGDIEVPYDELEKVEVDRSKLVLFSRRGITKLGMSKGYGATIGPVLTTISQGKFKVEQSVHSPNASRKQDN